VCVCVCHENPRSSKNQVHVDVKASVHFYRLSGENNTSLKNCFSLRLK